MSHSKDAEAAKQYVRHAITVVPTLKKVGKRYIPGRRTYPLIGEYGLLVILNEWCNGREITYKAVMAELTDYWMSPVTARRLIEKARSDGFVVISRSARDRRVQIITPTDKLFELLHAWVTEWSKLRKKVTLSK